MNGQVVRPLRWWTQVQLDAVALVLADPWSAWLWEWHGERPLTVTCTPAHEVQDGGVEWHPVAGAEDAWVWWERGDPEAGPVRTSLFGPEATVAAGSMAAAVERMSRKALEGRLANTLGLLEPMPAARVPALERSAWSGSLIVRVSAPSLSIRLFMNGLCVAKALGPLGYARPVEDLPPVEDGVSSLRTRASVELVGCEINLGDLQAVAVGDVLRLPHRLSEPMLVKVGDTPVCAAHLGRRADSRAVELLQAPGY